MISSIKVNPRKDGWCRRYQAALRKHLAQGPEASLRPAYELGCEATPLGLVTLEVAKMHARALLPLLAAVGSSGNRRKIIERAKLFFAETIVPIENAHHAALKTDGRINQLTRTLRRRTAESSASTRRLKRSIIQRQEAEQALHKSGKRHAKVLSELYLLQKRLRDLTHTCPSTQEDERKKMSLELDDEIAQALIAIELRLLILKKAARVSTARLKKEIAKTQRLVKESSKRIDIFAHEFGIQHKA